MKCCMLDTALLVGTKDTVMNKIFLNVIYSYFSLVLPYEFSHLLFFAYGCNILKFGLIFLRNTFFILEIFTELFNSFDS